MKSVTDRSVGFVVVLVSRSGFSLSTRREFCGLSCGSSSVCRRTSRVTGAVSPSPNTRNFSRYAIGIAFGPSEVRVRDDPRRVAQIEQQRRNGVRNRRALAPQNPEALDFRALHAEHLAELRRVSRPDLQEQHRLVRARDDASRAPRSACARIPRGRLCPAGWR